MVTIKTKHRAKAGQCLEPLLYIRVFLISPTQPTLMRTPLRKWLLVLLRCCRMTGRRTMAVTGFGAFLLNSWVYSTSSLLLQHGNPARTTVCTGRSPHSGAWHAAGTL